MGLDLVNIARTGVARTGLAHLNAGFVEFSGSGTLTASGAATGAQTEWVAVVGGSVTISGDAYVMASDYAGSSGGAMATAGNADVLVHFIAAAAGGSATTDGAAGFAPEYTPAASGSADTAGAADVLVHFIDAAAGGVAATAGDAAVLPEYLLDGSGEATTDGTAPAYPEFIGSFFGDALTFGAASDLVAHYIDVAGGLGGAATGGEAVVIFTIDVKGLPVYIRRFDGDVRLALSQDGGIIKIRGGQPEMDEGLETAVNLSLFSDGDWWGSSLGTADEAIGSGFLAALRAPLSNQARLDVIEAARTALAWLVSSGIAASVEISATIPAVGRLDLSILIRQPSKAPATFRYTVNWQSQRIAMQEAAA